MNRQDRQELWNAYRKEIMDELLNKFNIDELATYVATAEKGANEGDRDAQLSYGFLFLVGTECTTFDPVQAAYWLTKAAEQNDPSAQTAMGMMCYVIEDSHPEIEHEAAKWFMKAADQGNELAKNMLSMIRKDFQKHYQEHRSDYISDEDLAELAGQNVNISTSPDDISADELAELSKKIKSVVLIMNKEDCWNSCIEYINAMYKEVYLENDLEVVTETMQYLKRCAVQEGVDASGSAHEGYGLHLLVYTQDEVEAAKWLTIAAEKGKALAQLYLGFMYYCGRGNLPESKEKAVKYISKSQVRKRGSARELFFAITGTEMP